MAMKEYGQLKDFSLGINQKDAPTLIMDQELVDGQNALLGKGYIQKRHGFESFVYAPTISTSYLWNQFGSQKWSEV